MPKLKNAEYTAIAASVFGGIAASLGYNVAYAILPMSFALCFNAVNRDEFQNEHRRVAARLEQSLQVESSTSVLSIEAFDELRTNLDELGKKVETKSRIIDVDRVANDLASLNKITQDLNNLAEAFENRPELNKIAEVEAKLQQLNQQIINYKTDTNTSRITSQINELNSKIIGRNTSFTIWDNVLRGRLEEFSAIKEELIALRNGEISTVKDEIKAFDKIFNNPEHSLVAGRRESRAILIEALEVSEKELIIVCPWLGNGALEGLKHLFTEALEKEVKIEIGFGNRSDFGKDHNDVDITSMTIEDFCSNIDSNKLHNFYGALKYYMSLEQKYPNFKLRLLGTHEKFLISDRKFALIGSHNVLSSGDYSTERELGLVTKNPGIIDSLKRHYEEGLVVLCQPVGESSYKASTRINAPRGRAARMGIKTTPRKAVDMSGVPMGPHPLNKVEGSFDEFLAARALNKGTAAEQFDLNNDEDDDDIIVAPTAAKSLLNQTPGAFRNVAEDDEDEDAQYNTIN